MMAGVVANATIMSTSTSTTGISTRISSSAVLSASVQRPRFQILPPADWSKERSGHLSNVAVKVSATLDGHGKGVSRREAMGLSGAGLGALLLVSGVSATDGVTAAEFTDMPALRGKDYGKSKMSYPDYVQTESGLQYKDLRDGVGPNPREGDIVVIDWAGYTIGYYGKIFEARNKAKGGSFEGNEKAYFKFKVGEDQVIPAFEEAIKTMRVGGVRRIIVPSDLGYPKNDYYSKGPQPATFSGQRALDFVLKNEGLVDKTLLFDIELLRVLGK
ncbi:unnamed protein product [Calypogeia fissa]